MEKIDRTRFDAEWVGHSDATNKAKAEGLQRRIQSVLIGAAGGADVLLNNWAEREKLVRDASDLKDRALRVGLTVSSLGAAMNRLIADRITELDTPERAMSVPQDIESIITSLEEKS